MSSDYYTDLDTGYRKYLDENSFIDIFIINELSKNIDGYFYSVYFFKDKHSKLTIGPVWDFNLGFGNADYQDASIIEGFRVSLISTPWWWERLLQDELFFIGIRDRWCSIRENQFSNEKILNIIDSLSLLLDGSQQRNFERWDILGDYIWPNYYVGESYEDEIDFLKTWTSNRLQWLDDNLPCPISSIQNVSLSDKNCVYPNPFSNKAVLEFKNSKQEKHTLTIYNAQGQLVNTINGITTDRIEIERKNLNSGMYFFQIRTDKEIRTSGKLIIE